MNGCTLNQINSPKSPFNKLYLLTLRFYLSGKGNDDFDKMKNTYIGGGGRIRAMRMMNAGRTMKIIETENG